MKRLRLQPRPLRHPQQPQEIDLPLFRQFLVGFTLMVRPPCDWSSRDSDEFSRVEFPSLIDPPCAVSELQDRIELLDVHDDRIAIDDMTEMCLAGFPWSDSSEEDEEDDGPVIENGRNVLSVLLLDYDSRTLMELVGISCAFLGEDMVKKLTRSCGRKVVVASLVELFFSGTLPQMRREEEHLVLETFDPQRVSICFCGIDLPQEILLEIFSYVGSGYDLICTVGCVNMSFYYFVLSNWNREVIVKAQNLHSIPILVWKAVPFVRIFEDSPEDLELTDIEYSIAHLERESLVTLALDCAPQRTDVVFGCLDGRVLRDGAFTALRRIDFFRPSDFEGKRSWGYPEIRAIYDDGIRLATSCPNLGVVKWAWSLWWCEGLRCLRSLTIAAGLTMLDYEACGFPSYTERVKRRRDEIVKRLVKLRLHGVTAPHLSQIVHDCHPSRLLSLSLGVAHPRMPVPARTHVQMETSIQFEALQTILTELWRRMVKDIINCLCDCPLRKRLDSLKFYSVRGGMFQLSFDQVMNVFSNVRPETKNGMSGLRRAIFFKERLDDKALSVPEQVRLISASVPNLQEVYLTSFTPNFAPGDLAAVSKAFCRRRKMMPRRLAVISKVVSIRFLASGGCVDIGCRFDRHFEQPDLPAVVCLLSYWMRRTCKLRRMRISFDSPSSSDDFRILRECVSRLVHLAGSQPQEVRSHPRFWRRYVWLKIRRA